jgi:short-subunit dehydrogenase
MRLSANPPIRSWKPKKVWIIGSSTGIGAALATALARRGAHVVLSARTAERLERLAAECERASVVAFDASDPGAWPAARERAEADGAPVDLLVYCAADYRPERIWNVHAADVRATLEVNLAGVYYAIEAVLPAMVARSSGGLALVASVAGYVGLPGAAVYGPTKAALINLAELTYSEVTARGVSVYLINPGFVATRLTAKNRFRMPAIRTPEQAAESIIQGFERGRFEIHFPWRFTMALKFVRALPQRLRLALLSRLAR